MQLSIAGLIAHLHAQFRKAQLKFSPRLSDTNFLPWNWHFKEHQVAKTPDLLFISTGMELFFFPFPSWKTGLKIKLKDEREKTNIQRNVASLHAIKNKLVYLENSYNVISYPTSKACPYFPIEGKTYLTILQLYVSIYKYLYLPP